MPTVDTASTVAMDRSLKRDKEMIEMRSSFRYLDRACGESIRTQQGAAKTKRWSKQQKRRGRMFVGSVERGCRTLAVGAMELPWVLIGGRPPIAPTGLLPSAPQKGAVHCVYSNGEVDLQLLVYRLLSGGNGFGRGAGLRKVCSWGVFEEMVKSIGTRSRVTWISCCLC